MSELETFNEREQAFIEQARERVIAFQAYLDDGNRGERQIQGIIVCALELHNSDVSDLDFMADDFPTMQALVEGEFQRRENLHKAGLAADAEDYGGPKFEVS